MNEKYDDDDDDDNILPVGVDSLSDYTPYKLNILLDIPISSHDSPSMNTKSAKTRNFIRCFLPNSRTRSISTASEQSSNDIYDMRFLIIRHGERVDRYFGPNWYKSAFDSHQQYRPYHRNYPSTLPHRSNIYFWALDTPLTSMGLDAAEKLGRTLAKKNLQPQYVYSSPAMRCMLTTIQILKGLKLPNQLPIRIEPGLLEFGASKFGMNIFLQPNDWHQSGIHVDLSYQPILPVVPPQEREEGYYLRSKHVIREIEKRHQSKQLRNILLVAHATSPDTLTWDLIGKQPDVNDLYRLSMTIPYLQTVIIEHKQDEPYWSIRWLK